MRSIMNKPPREKVDADDGDAWSFSFYDEQGKRIFHWDTDYTYGIKRFEKLQDKLCRFMPDWWPRYRGSILEKMMDVKNKGPF